ncbi:hypothetical protein O3M35_003465 [Rhynocoris fuscipes]|uniref:Protein kinase domain-containing protein n=1 Tax=Rhynocoris fuscipes TaxID=488301 RepID=A0AAW1CRP5_9HEMI
MNLSKNSSKISQNSSILSKHNKSYKLIEENIKYEINKRRGKPPLWKIDDFQIGFQLGEGKFGEIFLARIKAMKYLLALKIIYKSRLVNEGNLKQFTTELKILTKLKHQNLLKLYTYFYDATGIYLIMEYAENGDVYGLINKQVNRRLSEGTVARYIYQVCDGIQYCHKLGIIHSNLKPENLLLDFNGNIKITGFDQAVFSYSKDILITSNFVSLEYLAPEIIMKQCYDFLVDNWNIGILCYELLTGYTPFQEIYEKNLLKKMVKSDIFYPAVISANARNLIKKLLKFKANDRLELNGVMKHRWIIRFVGNKKCFVK